MLNYKNDLMEPILSSTYEVSKDLLEIGIDSLLEDGTMKEIPIVGTVVGILNLGKNITNAIFMKKLLNFIFNLNSISIEERKMFIDKCIKDDKNFSEKMFEVIDKIDDIDKCKYFTKIFICYGKGYIDYKTFRKFCVATQRLNIYDIEYLRNNLNAKDFGDYGISIHNAGLAKIITYPGCCGYSASDECLIFYKCLFEYDLNDSIEIAK